MDKMNIILLYAIYINQGMFYVYVHMWISFCPYSMFVSTYTGPLVLGNA